MNSFRLALAAAALTVAVSAQAGDLPALKGELIGGPGSEQYFTVGANIGTLGPGFELGYRVNSYVGVRGGFNWIGDTFNVSSSSNSYGVAANWFEGRTVVDLYPFQSVFRLTAGLHYGRPTVSGHVTPPVGLVNVGGTSYFGSVGRLNADAGFGSPVLPYVGLGIEGAPFFDNLIFGLDAGVVVLSNPKIKITQTGGNVVVSPADLQAEANKVNSNWQKFPVYPVVQASVKYKF